MNERLPCMKENCSLLRLNRKVKQIIASLSLIWLGILTHFLGWLAKSLQTGYTPEFKEYIITQISLTSISYNSNNNGNNNRQWTNLCILHGRPLMDASMWLPAFMCFPTICRRVPPDLGPDWGVRSVISGLTKRYFCRDSPRYSLATFKEKSTNKLNLT